MIVEGESRLIERRFHGRVAHSRLLKEQHKRVEQGVKPSFEKRFRGVQEPKISGTECPESLDKLKPSVHYAWKAVSDVLVCEQHLVAKQFFTFMVAWLMQWGR